MAQMLPIVGSRSLGDNRDPTVVEGGLCIVDQVIVPNNGSVPGIAQVVIVLLAEVIKV
jgi:hypothetical protein